MSWDGLRVLPDSLLLGIADHISELRSRTTEAGFPLPESRSKSPYALMVEEVIREGARRGFTGDWILSKRLSP